MLLEEDGEPDLTRTVRLTAVAIETGHEQALTRRPCIVAADGRRLRPSAAATAFADAAASAGPAHRAGALDVLGIVVDLHPAYWEEDQWSKRVVEWLRRRDCLVRRDDTAAVLKIAARLGEAGGVIPGATDEVDTARLVALQRALGEMPKKVRESLGPGIGRAIRLRCFTYDAAGNEQPQRRKPRTAYLSQALESADGDRFAVAARKTPGLAWVHRSYARALLSAASRCCSCSASSMRRVIASLARATWNDIFAIDMKEM
ncbi:hypothetical protein OG851_42990 (plasmid) [Streptomyces sp. NBC_00161]|uniref:hypothetical protein n=1 Tax=Streptomyces sp. NBC_00161 TaxID=2975671 RepID=UPI00324C52C4